MGGATQMPDVLISTLKVSVKPDSTLWHGFTIIMFFSNLVLLLLLWREFYMPAL